MTRPVKNALLTMHTPQHWLWLLVVAVLVLVLVPALNLGLSAGSTLWVADHWIPLLGKILCFALVALAMDLIWGFTGILSLGHTVFFSLGGYIMGMHLMRAIGTDGVYRSELPDFMVFLDWKELPWYWHGSHSLGFAVLMALVIPGLLAFAFGYMAFRSRIRGVYLSIITQALTYSLMLLFFRNETGLGGNNGLTGFKRLAGVGLHEQTTKVGLYVASGLALLLGYLVCRFVVTSKLGRVLVAIRDQETRTMFIGYDPLRYKVFAWTLSAVLCGLAGALYVPQVGIINPSELHPANGIEMAIWVAMGGRGTLVGAIAGAVIVNGSKSWLTTSYPELWLFVLGFMFIAVTMLVPRGLVGSLMRAERDRLALARRRRA